MFGHVPFFGTYHFGFFRIKVTCESDPSMLFCLPGLDVMKNHCFGINAHSFICQVGHPIIYRTQKNPAVQLTSVGVAQARPTY